LPRSLPPSGFGGFAVLAPGPTLRM
jgi:hypothetical protein